MSNQQTSNLRHEKSAVINQFNSSDDGAASKRLKTERFDKVNPEYHCGYPDYI